LPYYEHGVLPEAGGSLDQDPDIMDALNFMSLMVGWYIQNERKDDPESLPEL